MPDASYFSVAETECCFVLFIWQKGIFDAIINSNILHGLFCTRLYKRLMDISVTIFSEIELMQARVDINLKCFTFRMVINDDHSFSIFSFGYIKLTLTYCRRQ